ncbi:MAG: NAD(P)-dependent oxidoreductase [Phycisphaeraceae bacterium]
MADLPVMLKVAGRRCVVVGGGGVAVRRAGALVDCGAHVVVVAPAMDAGLAGLPVQCVTRAYQRGDLEGAFLVVVATCDAAVNQAVAEDAAKLGVLVNRADDPASGDVTVPAHSRLGPITLAVHTGGISASAAATLQRQLAAAIDPDWRVLLETAGPHRAAIQARFADAEERRRRLMALTDEAAMARLKRDGVEGLQERCREVTDAPAVLPVRAPPC